MPHYGEHAAVNSPVLLRGDKRRKAHPGNPGRTFHVGINPGDFLLSHTVTRAVPSAPAGLTSVFGMGTGVTLPTKSPENFFRLQIRFQISDLKLEIQKILENRIVTDKAISKNLKFKIPNSKSNSESSSRFRSRASANLLLE